MGFNPTTRNLGATFPLVMGGEEEGGQEVSVVSQSTTPAPAPASLASRVARSTDIPGNRQGRKSTGLYPHISRTKLAELTGYHITTITGMLKGRTRVTLDLAVLMAREIGVTVEQLSRELARKQEEYQKREKGRVVKKGVTGTGTRTGKQGKGTGKKK